MKPLVNLFWFRRDLRLHDNCGLYHALKDGSPVVPIFIFDRNILDELEDRRDRRVEFIHQSIQQMQSELIEHNSSIDIRYGFPGDVFTDLIKDYRVGKVFTNRDYEPYARDRDERVEEILKSAGISFHSFKDHVIFEKDEVIKDDRSPYTIFTPYARRWQSVFSEKKPGACQSEMHFSNFYHQAPLAIPELRSIDFFPTQLSFPSSTWNEEMLKDYKLNRDFPAANGTSQLSVHLRFGTISIRQLVQDAIEKSETFLNELIWREFYQMILWHFPKVVTESFKKEYDEIKWRNNEKEFDAWCRGMTGYPIVDAGMRELNATGFMHNRVRMIVASFLTKHLLIDWRWGEAYFAKKLIDYELASNNGGWQWAAGTGCDAAPYFRIFNPYLQTKKFDPDLQYIRQWVPEFEELTYPKPIVEHEFARKRCLAAYKEALYKNRSAV